MTNETIKALLMIGLFGTFEFALYFPRIRQTTVPFCRAVASLLIPVATIGHVLVPVRTGRQKR